jgi:hypothetical protein
VAGPFSTAVTPIPTLIYSPSPSGIPHVVVTNTGLYPIYIGSASVSPGSGMYLAPRGQVTLPNAPVALYAVSAYTVTATATTTTSNVTAGTGTVAVTSGTSLTNGSYILLAAGTAIEAVQISSGGTTTTLTTTKPLYDHLSGVAVTLITGQAGSVSVSAGTS